MATVSVSETIPRRRAVGTVTPRSEVGYTAHAILKDTRNCKDETRPYKSRKSKNPLWVDLGHAVLKVCGLLAILVCLYMGIINWCFGGTNQLGSSLAILGEIGEVEKFVKMTEMLQVQLDAVDKKLQDLISSISKIETNGERTDLKLNALDERTNVLEKKKFMDGFMTKEELGDFVEEFKESKKNSGVDKNEIIAYAREIVEKEIERHAADGLGTKDYALASIGSRVLKHSESIGCMMNFYGVCERAQKMITPSFGEPGQCFPLKGDNGFVEIKLTTAIVAEAVTLEHVAKSVDRSRISAPKQCRVSGWLHGQDLRGVKVDQDQMFFLTEFTYDLEKNNVQTYKVVESAASRLVDTIRLDFTSNHGGAYTCIYRLRVHGHKPGHMPL
ncbi:hypothetical protein ACJIZ3_006325 [Penstemon smallii]|uniref:SUN domain-containing protein n=1 Tax=Penstemon smallii TaxID=265156 RepID=A0ABD3S7N9_9LAMI